MSAHPISARLTSLPREQLLRLALKLDAVVTAANGVAYLTAAEPIGDLLGLAPSLLRPVGAFLLLFAAAVWLVATRPAIAQGAVTTVIAANVLWAGGSVVFAILGASSPTTAGTVWIVLQGLVVGLLAALQVILARADSPGR